MSFLLPSERGSIKGEGEHGGQEPSDSKWQWGYPGLSPSGPICLTGDYISNKLLNWQENKWNLKVPPFCFVEGSLEDSFPGFSQGLIWITGLDITCYAALLSSHTQCPSPLSPTLLWILSVEEPRLKLSDLLAVPGVQGHHGWAKQKGPSPKAALG